MFALVTLWGIEGAALVKMEVEGTPNKVRIVSDEIVWVSFLQFEEALLSADYFMVERALPIGFGSGGTYRELRINGEKLYKMVLRKPHKGE